MARRRTMEGEPKAKEAVKDPFQPDEFDETEHMQKENRSAKMLGISLGVAIVAGLVSFLLMRAALLVGGGFHLYLPLVSPVLFFGAVLYLFSRFGIVIKELDWKKWLENGAMYLLTWFVVWMVSMNPPFTDISGPVISDDLVQLDLDSQVNVSYIDYNSAGRSIVGDDVLGENDFVPIEARNGLMNISIFLLVTDNWKVKEVNLTLNRLVQGEWEEMRAHPALNITIGRIKDEGAFEPSKKEQKELNKVWSGGSEEVWEENLYGLRIEVRDPASPDLRGQMDLKLSIWVKDGSSNESSRDIIFSIKVS